MENILVIDALSERYRHAIMDFMPVYNKNDRNSAPSECFNKATVSAAEGKRPGLVDEMGAGTLSGTSDSRVQDALVQS